ncbi:Peptidase family M1 [bacterium A37T11]|nr:Peptidase family M1 [bacterium A37T11]
MNRITIAISFWLLTFQGYAQLLQHKEPVLNKADTLRGSLTSPMRTCYDIGYYHLDVKLDIAKQAIRGSNLFQFMAVTTFDSLQFDLFKNLQIDSIIYDGSKLTYTRQYNAVFIRFPETIQKGQVDSFLVYYSGRPVVAKRAPWDGGIVYSKDSHGKPWVATACQGLGASAWFPNKDQQADEVDSALISISVPTGLTDVSNGRLRSKTNLKNGYTRFDWFVKNPISSYCISMNVGDYVNFKDTYAGEKGPLDLSFWVLKENLEKAKAYFPANVKSMLKAFEHWFGPYPFYEDSYKLVDAPYLGMEHQSAVTYGNHYGFGYLGGDGSGTGWGMKWDFIIVHESGHEWFGNNITSKDLADMWIHESFTNYSEALYIESYFGKKASQEYIHGNRDGILNDQAIQGPFGVNKEGSGDMYNKGGVLLNMVRTMINNDEKWRDILRGLNKTFYHQTVGYDDVIKYINQQSGMDFSAVFSQYLRYPNIPTLEMRLTAGKFQARWIADVPNFEMPVRIKAGTGPYQVIKPTCKWQSFEIPGATNENLQVDTFNFYIGLLLE